MKTRSKLLILVLVVIVAGLLLMPSGDLGQGRISRFLDLNPRGTIDVELKDERPDLREDPSRISRFFDFFGANSGGRPVLLGNSAGGACADKFGGEWDLLVHGTYEWDKSYKDKYKFAIPFDEETPADVQKALDAINTGKYDEYCYSQKAVLPENSKLAAVRKCEVINDFIGSVRCKFTEKLPEGPKSGIGGAYKTDEVRIDKHYSGTDLFPSIKKVRWYGSVGEYFIGDGSPYAKHKMEVALEARKTPPGSAAPKPDCYINPYPVKPRNAEISKVDCPEPAVKLTDLFVGEKGGVNIAVEGDKNNMGLLTVQAKGDLHINKIVYKWGDYSKELSGNQGNFKQFDLLTYDAKQNAKKVASAIMVNGEVVFNNLKVPIQEGEEENFQLLAYYESIQNGAKSGTADAFQVASVTSASSVTGKEYVDTSAADFNLVASYLYKKSFFSGSVGTNTSAKMKAGNNDLFNFNFVVDKHGDVAIRKLSFLLDGAASGGTQKFDLSNVRLLKEGVTIEMLSPKDGKTKVNNCSDGGNNEIFNDGEYWKNKKIVCSFAEPLYLSKGTNNIFSLEGFITGLELGDVVATRFDFGGTLTDDWALAHVNTSLGDGEVLELNTKTDGSGKSFDTAYIWSDLVNNGKGDWTTGSFLPMVGISKILSY